MFAATQNPLREVLHWTEQAFFALLLLAGMGLVFYAVVAPSGPNAVPDAPVRLVEQQQDAAEAYARAPSFHFNRAS